MPSLMQGQDGAAQARAASAASAEAARLDAQLEVAAKKAALRSLESQAAGSDVAPAAPVTASGTVTIEKDGHTIVLENPTPDQLAQLTGGSNQPGPPEGWMIVTMTGGVLLTVLILVWMLLNRNRRGVPTAPKEAAETAARMARIENAVESIAVEVERISEGQRYTTRMLSEGAAIPVAVPDRGDAVLRNRAEG